MADLEADYREMLMNEFKERVARNKRYSLRAFARDLGVNPGYLPKLFAGKTIPSLETAQDIADRMRLEKVEKARFLKSVAEDQKCHALYVLDPTLTECSPETHAANALPAKKKRKKTKKAR